MENIINILKERLTDNGFTEVGVKLKQEFGISDKESNAILQKLEAEGFVVYGLTVKLKANPKKHVCLKILCNPELTCCDVYRKMLNQ